MRDRIKDLKDILRRSGLDAILISNPSNIYYISAFSGHDSYCLITKAEAFIITDTRYQEQAEKESPDFDIIGGSGNLLKKTNKLINRLSPKNAGFESTHLSVKELEVISDGLKIKMHPTFHLIESQRVIKTSQELELIRRAASIASSALKKAIKELKTGQTERGIAAKIDLFIRREGADYPAFETIVASGPNASMPHAKATNRKIRPSEPIIIDCGGRLTGYNSDLTRTHFVGKISKSFKLIYNIVEIAQKRAISKISPGRKMADIDKAARDYIRGKGFGKYFGHATGHGIGIDVHEPPSINYKNQAILKEGMVFTVEPGIYIPGCGGVRIEDMVLVTDKGCEVLTR